MKKSNSQLMIIAGIAIVTAVAFTGMYIMRPTAPVEKLEDRVERVEVITATRKDYFPKVSTQAVVESRFNITLKSQVTGQVLYISPKFLTGGYFDTGEVILRIDPRDYELALVQAEVNVARAEQTLSVEREQADLARQDWDKYGEGDATELVLRIPQLREAEAGLKGAQANYDAQNIRLGRTEVKAPFPLMIGEKQVDLGQIVGNNQDLANVFGTDEAEIRMPLSQKQMDLLSVKRVGILPEADVLKVKVRDLTREDNIVWDADILRIESNIDRKSRVYYAIGTVMDPMNLKGDKETPPLLPGVFVDLEVMGPKIGNVFQVPVKAMRDDNNIYIFEDEKLITKPVNVLDRDQLIVTILSGIDEGEKITTTPPFSYVPGMKSEISSLDGVPVSGGPGGRGRGPGGGGRQAAAASAPSAPSGGVTAAAAAESPAPPAAGERPNPANMTPEQRRAAVANMTPEQRAAMQARRAARQAGGAQPPAPQGGNQ
ncbi:MAG: efflux RND transporter periplasmic adaptor subunit [Kordiimonadaceae bacterium]|jgi:membrane fusion protein, multidrug efflux system|nr:efflux RND transporter periplasmic adaptor subunit [Kordiimonadaceae bacterium]MBT6035903.1 efflux RND transporter periplasmic adaptor subunit [Kordiimonadaceae bacterium]MBT6329331.1 efflux RND transporter periplasmic adaptor subunit [Kordiimonadaceae bacterium]